jgi:hypothetical protein
MIGLGWTCNSDEGVKKSFWRLERLGVMLGLRWNLRNYIVRRMELAEDRARFDVEILCFTTVKEITLELVA